jgi:hypothetical protein
MRLIQYCSMLVAGSDIEKSKGHGQGKRSNVENHKSF